MKKNLVIPWTIAVGLLLGSAFVAQAATSESGARSDSTVAHPRRCDEPKIKACATECERACAAGPRRAECVTKCDRDCRTRFCR